MRVISLAVAALQLGALLAADDWKPLWNGKDLAGWIQVGPGQFVVENGALKTTGGMGLLYWNGGRIKDSVLRVVYKTGTKSSNAGVFIRIPEAPTEPWMPVNRGYEVQIDDNADDHHVTGTLYSLTTAKARPSRPGEWNTLEIALEGPRTRVTVNGALVTDYREGEPVPDKKEKWEPDRGPRPEAGFIGLQNHSDKDVVFFKEISLRPLGKGK
jgi:hypothetical protein